jgi:hypothetical protein
VEIIFGRDQGIMKEILMWLCCGGGLILSSAKIRVKCKVRGVNYVRFSVSSCLG